MSYWWKKYVLGKERYVCGGNVFLWAKSFIYFQLQILLYIFFYFFIFLFFYFLRASLGCLVFYFYFCQQAWDALFFFLFLPASVGCLGLPWVINLTKTKKNDKSFAPPQKLT
jgi:hypothetical protein